MANNGTDAYQGAATAKSAVENNYLFKQEAERQAELLTKQEKEGLTDKEREELTELRKLDDKRDRNLQIACYSGMTAACANELIILSETFHSYDTPQTELKNVDTRTEYLDVATKYGEVKRQYAEDVAREALVKIASDNIADSAELVKVTAKAITGDETSQVQLHEIGKAIKALVQSPITTISDSIKSQLAEADRLEAIGQSREADVMRMQVYLSSELGVISGLSSIASITPSALKTAAKYELVVDPSILSANGFGGVKIVRKIDGVEDIHVDVNIARQKGSEAYKAINELRPSAAYNLSNGTYFRTNQHGYVEEISFKPDFDNKGVRDSRQTLIGKEGISGDVGGHIQACAMGGSCDRYNLFPQNSNFNNSAYKVYFENIIKRAAMNGNEIDNVTIKFTRNNPALSRPSKLEVMFTIDGKPQVEEFINRYGGGK
ncbi:hypothetical protein OA57_05570 [Chelonobacter oris]|uniref:Uncharacterized protein n=1 Tax=Chelonobacter oris TaxID=505317 RepID=A0A0A3AMF3_9PAST|nr:hypothetical protein OA57_05570 [Chelonobacter oris]